MDATTTTSHVAESTQSAAADPGFWKEVRHIVWGQKSTPSMGSRDKTMYK